MRVRRASLVMLAFALTACGSVAPLSSRASSASRISNNPAPPADSLCNLPVFNWGWQTSGPIRGMSGQNGFLSLASGQFTPDPNGVFVPDEATSIWSSKQTPVLHGDGSASYDIARRRWLPVASPNVLPDGSAYVYEVELRDGSGYDIHRVNVATGTDKLIYHMPYDSAYQILAFEPEGVYVFPIIHRSGIAGGLWLLSSTGPTITAVPGAADEPWQLIAGAEAWGGPEGGGTLDRLDLSTGVITTWFQHPVFVPQGMGPSYGLYVVGFDRSNHPLVQVYPPGDTAASPARVPGPELWLVSAPGHAEMLNGLPIPEQGLTQGVTDSRGTWIVGADGVYLYTDSGFQRVALLPSPPAPNYALAGPCV